MIFKNGCYFTAAVPEDEVDQSDRRAAQPQPATRPSHEPHYCLGFDQGRIELFLFSLALTS